MNIQEKFEILLVTAPGLEAVLCEEAREIGFSEVMAIAGGVTIQGNLADVWRANLVLRGATRVLARLGSFRAPHLAQLDKRARKFPWGEVLRADIPIRVEATCKSSRIYHSGAAAQRIATAIHEELGAPVAKDAPITIMARIEDDLCTISVDTSGESLHKRGHKEAIAKAPLRETLAASFLRQCGYVGQEPVLDPMCGSGTFVIEAAEIALGMSPGRNRHFAFEYLKTFDVAKWSSMKAMVQGRATPFRFFGSDRDAGAIKASEENAERAGVKDVVQFQRCAISAVQKPDGPAGLVIVNPPYGTRIGDKKPLFALHASLGKMLKERFSGWRVGLVTADKQLAYATGMPFKPPGPPVNHGGLRVTLFQTGPLP
jgi:putative N6-adenine-specific DNA methylase